MSFSIRFERTISSQLKRKGHTEDERTESSSLKTACSCFRVTWGLGLKIHQNKNYSIKLAKQLSFVGGDRPNYYTHYFFNIRSVVILSKRFFLNAETQWIERMLIISLFFFHFYLPNIRTQVNWILFLLFSTVVSNVCRFFTVSGLFSLSTIFLSFFSFHFPALFSDVNTLHFFITPILSFFYSLSWYALWSIHAVLLSSEMCRKYRNYAPGNAETPFNCVIELIFHIFFC